MHLLVYLFIYVFANLCMCLFCVCIYLFIYWFLLFAYLLFVYLCNLYIYLCVVVLFVCLFIYFQIEHTINYNKSNTQTTIIKAMTIK